MSAYCITSLPTIICLCETGCAASGNPSVESTGTIVTLLLMSAESTVALTPATPSEIPPIILPRTKMRAKNEQEQFSEAVLVEIEKLVYAVEEPVFLEETSLSIMIRMLRDSRGVIPKKEVLVD